CVRGTRPQGRTEAWRAGHSDVPKLFEVRESPLYGYLSRFDRLETRASPQVTHSFESRRVNTRRVDRLKSHCPQLDTDWLQCEPAAQYDPSIGRNYAARTHYPRHLGDAFSGVGHKKDHQSHYCHIECVRREWKCHRIPTLEFSQTRARSFARKVELSLGWIDAPHFVRRAPFNNQFSKSAVAATYINPFQARR